MRPLQEIDNEDLFALILLSTTNLPEEHITNISKFIEILNDPSYSYCSSINLLKNCIKYDLPILSILSATVSPLNLEWNWLIWLTVSTKCYQEFIRDPISLHKILEFCVSSGFIAVVDKSFKIFFEVIYYVYKFLNIYRIYTNYNLEKKIINFQKILFTGVEIFPSNTFFKRHKESDFL